MYKIPRKYKRKSKKKPKVVIGYANQDIGFFKFESKLDYTGDLIPKVGECIMDSHLKYRIRIIEIVHCNIEGQIFICLITDDKIEWTKNDGAKFIEEGE